MNLMIKTAWLLLARRFWLSRVDTVSQPHHANARETKLLSVRGEMLIETTWTPC